jgi:NB-ARC domain
VTRFRWRPSRALKIGVLAGIGVLASLATGLYLPSGRYTSWFQLGFALIASILSGWLAIVQMSHAPTAQSQPVGPDSDVGRPHQLPSGLADFTDRDAQQVHLREVLEGAGHDVVVATVSGKAGVGKTALAVHVARLVASNYLDGQLYVDLRGAEELPLSADEALAGFLRQLGIPGQAIPEQGDERSQLFRSRLWGRRVLVLLDNAGDEGQVRPLIPGSAGTAVLITSRTALAGLARSVAVALDVLDTESATTLLIRIVGPDRVASEPEAADRIVQLCGGLPLAVRICGARLAAKPHWTLAWFVARLADERGRLSELRAGDLEVRSSFALSYRSLASAERAAFHLLGLLDGPDFAPWHLAALRAESGDPDDPRAETLLESLADAQLVEAVAGGADGAGRYRFHNLLRVFARERMADEVPEAEQQAAVRRVIDTSLQRATAAAAALRFEASAPRNVAGVDPLTWFTIERAGLIAVLDRATAMGLAAQVCDLSMALTPFFEIRARWRDWRYASTLALDAATAAADRRGRANALQSLGADVPAGVAGHLRRARRCRRPGRSPPHPRGRPGQRGRTH